jgi:hypothetical protein
MGGASSGPIMDNQWHHVAAVFDGSNSKFYLDGVLKETVPFSGTPALNTRDLFIGKHYSLGRYFHGIIDEVRIYNRALSDTEILQLSIAGGQACIQAPAGLVSWWPGDGNANDIIDSNHGTLQGGATFGTGHVGQAFSLDGTNDFVVIPHSSSLNFGTNDFTVDLWVKFTSTTGEQVIIEKLIETMNATRTGWTLTKLSNNVIRLAGPLGGDGRIIDAVPPSIPVNTWIFVAVTRTGNTFTLYWNGVPIGSATMALNLDTSTSLKLGHRGNPTDTPGSVDTRGMYLKGFIDEVEIFNRSLNASELQSIFNAGSYGKCKAPSTGVLTLSPADGLTSSGNQGGPFNPSSKVYTLQNTGGATINWTTSKTQPWINLSATSGFLSPGATATITLSINSNANSLISGTYYDTVNFTNTTNGSGNTTRGVTLHVTTANQCATFDFLTNTLHVPCFNLDTASFWIDLGLIGYDPINFEIKNFADNGSSGNLSECATFDFFTNTFHIPCFILENVSYWLDLSLVSYDQIRLQLANFGEISGASAMIGPAGGTVEVTNPASPLYGVKIEVPAGALSKDTTITINKAVNLPSFPFAGNSQSVVIEIGPPGTIFGVPATITIPYKDDADESFLGIFGYSEGEAGWTYLPFALVDKNSNKAVFKISHLSGYGLSKFPKLPSGTHKFFISEGFGATARATIQAAIRYGAFLPYFDCTGIDFQEVTSENEADFIVKLGDPTGPDKNGNTVPYLSGYIRRTPASQAEIVIRNNVPLYDKETLPISAGAYDLYSMIVHELSHYFGIPTVKDEDDPDYPENGVFDDKLLPGDPPARVLLPDDERIFKLKYPECNCSNIAGTWNGTSTPEHGEITNIAFILSQDGCNVTGTWVSSHPIISKCGLSPVAISGSVSENTFSFTSPSRFVNAETCEIVCSFTRSVNLTIDGDRMYGTNTNEDCNGGSYIYSLDLTLSGFTSSLLRTLGKQGNKSARIFLDQHGAKCGIYLDPTTGREYSNTVQPNNCSEK